MNSPQPDRKLLGFWDLMGLSLGQIIGTGVVVLTGISISMTEFGAPWAFTLALAIVAIPSLCIAALGSAVPNTGGNYTYVRDLLGPKTSFVYLALLVAGQIILASYAIGFAEYANALMPGINMMLVGAGIMTACFIANLLGIKTAARFQNLMVYFRSSSISVSDCPMLRIIRPTHKRRAFFPMGLVGFLQRLFFSG